MSTHNASVYDPNITLSDNDLDVVNEINKFLEECTSDGVEQIELSNLSNELDDEFLKNFDTPDLEVNNSNTVETTSGLDFVGENPAVFHLLEDFGTYDHNLNEINRNIFHPTHLPDEQNHGVQQEFKNDGFISNSITISKMENLPYPCKNNQNANIEQTMIETKQFPTNQQNQGSTFLEKISKETNLFDKFKEMEKFSFSLKCNNNQEDVATTRNPCGILRNSSTPLDVINEKTGPDSNFSLSLHKNDKIQNYRKSAWWNRKKTWKGNIREPKRKGPFKYNSQKKYSSSFPINGINYSVPKTPFTQRINSKIQSSKPFLSGNHQPAKKMQDKNQFGKNMPSVCINQEYQNSNIGNYKSAFNDIHQTSKISTSTNQFPNGVSGSHYSLNPYDLNKQKIHKQHFNMPHYENNLVRKHSDTSVMPVQQNSFHDPNLQYPQTCVKNKIVSKDQGYVKKSCKVVLLQIIKDNLCPISLDEKTIGFSSKKLVRTNTRIELIAAFRTHGTLENSWWTPDDKIFITYTKKDIAQFVYGMYLKY